MSYGTVLERLSGKKLLFLCILMFLCQIIMFLVGGLKAPAPNSAEQILAVTCADRQYSFNSSDMIFLRPYQNSNCEQIDLEDTDISNPNMVVFAFQIPLPKNSYELDMSRWFNSMLSILMIDIEYHPNIPLKSKTIRIEAKLAYRNKAHLPNDWKIMATSNADRALNCEIDDSSKIEGYYYNCSTLPFFELGNVFYDFYLVNLRIPVFDSVNQYIGKIKDIWLVKRGFERTRINYVIVLSYLNTKFRFLLQGNSSKWWLHANMVLDQNIFFPILLFVTLWYLNRINQLSRSMLLFEKVLLTLAISLSLLNFPVDWFTLFLNMPYMLFYSDIRQGIFYSVLLCFWIVFVGEHLMDEHERNSLSAYSKHLGPVAVGCICMFIFDVCERGIELKDPFFSIWSTDAGSTIALFFVYIAGISGCVYLIFLSYMIVCVLRNINRKKASFPKMSSIRRMKYQGIIYRFNFLIFFTFVCASLTIIFYMLSHISESHWKWSDTEVKLEYTSAFFTGMYAMWNVYVFALLVFYAPSHKNKYESDGEKETILINSLNNNQQHEVSVLSAFLRKEGIE